MGCFMFASVKRRQQQAENRSQAARAHNGSKLHTELTPTSPVWSVYVPLECIVRSRRKDRQNALVGTTRDGVRKAPGRLASMPERVRHHRSCSNQRGRFVSVAISIWLARASAVSILFALFPGPNVLNGKTSSLCFRLPSAVHEGSMASRTNYAPHSRRIMCCAS